MIDNWRALQKSSREVLSAGLEALVSQPEMKAADVIESSAGVYLVSLNSMPVYTGEARALSSRIKQQFSTRSTFYKNYLRYSGKDLEPRLDISSFKVQYLPTTIGRKELEEFSIVNLGLTLNMAMGRQDDSFEAVRGAPELWAEVQAAAPRLLSDGSGEFLCGASVAWNDCEPPRAPGVYRVHREDSSMIYVGESSDLKRRYHNHSTHSRGSALRRHVGTELLGLDFERPKTLSKNGETLVNTFLSECTIFGESLSFGRYELEDLLIKEQQPLLNRKGKKVG